MSRNGSGVFTLVAGNPAVTGTTISSTVHNNTMNDIASELTNSVDKDGQTVITGVIDHNGQKIILDVDGDTSITADTDDTIDFEIGGADVVQMTATGMSTTGTLAAGHIGVGIAAQSANMIYLLGTVGVPNANVTIQSHDTTSATAGITLNARDVSNGNKAVNITNNLGVLVVDVIIDASAGGIYLGGTAAANVLDDYEEGTWTPVFKDTSTAGTTVAITIGLNTYTKIGNFSYLGIYNTRNDATAFTGVLFVTAMPFTAMATVQVTSGGLWSDTSSTDTKALVYIGGGGTDAQFPECATANSMTTDKWQNARPIYCSAQYQTA